MTTSTTDYKTTITMLDRDQQQQQPTHLQNEIDEGAVDEFDVPASLLNRCGREYKWTLSFATRVSHSYRQFMALKKTLQDYDSQILAPSLTIDLMWHQHVLDVKHYVRSCLAYCSNIIGYNPDIHLNKLHTARKLEQTRDHLVHEFGSFDQEIWDFEDMKAALGVVEEDGDDLGLPAPTFESADNATAMPSDTSNAHYAKRTREVSPSSPPTSSSSSSSAAARANNAKLLRTIVLVKVRNSGGRDFYFKLHVDQMFFGLFCAYAKRCGVDYKRCRFTYLGSRLEPCQTPSGIPGMLDDIATEDDGVVIQVTHVRK